MRFKWFSSSFKFSVYEHKTVSSPSSWPKAASANVGIMDAATTATSERHAEAEISAPTDAQANKWDSKLALVSKGNCL